MRLKHIFLLLVFLTQSPRAQQQAAEPELAWRDARTLTVEGRGWTNTEDFYDRLPAKAKDLVRTPVWSLSKHSAGIKVRFKTDATLIAARWKVHSERLAMPHMPATGVSGLDLYVRRGDGWNWLAGGRPERFPLNEKTLVKGLPPASREYALYLPLYNGTDSLEIGTPKEASLQPPDGADVVGRPLVFYGTSITHGGCASRPGMAYPAIIGRRLNRPVINLGFSGNGKTEPEMARLLAELNPAAYILDSLPNLTPEETAERIGPFVSTLRAAHPDTPIILVENILYPDRELVEARRERCTKSNAWLKSFFTRSRKAGDRNLHYLPADDLLGLDGEGTVDGTHPTDLGFLRMADKMTPLIRKVLGSRK